MDVQATYDALFIDGRWQPSRGDGVDEVVNPAAGVAFGSVPTGTLADVDAAIAAARTAFDSGPWPTMTQRERTAALLRFAEVLESWQSVIAPLIMQESGALQSLVDGTHFALGLSWARRSRPATPWCSSHRRLRRSKGWCSVPSPRRQGCRRECSTSSPEA